MLFQAQREFNLDLTRTTYIGDDERDRQAAEAAGCRYAMVSDDSSLLTITQGMVKLNQAGHEVVGLDTGYYSSCSLLADGPSIAWLHTDLRRIELSDLKGFDAVVHLGALSNDPIGNMNERWTEEINHHASVRLKSRPSIRRRNMPVRRSRASERFPKWRRTRLRRPSCAMVRFTGYRRACGSIRC
jgi:hypothetical protein